MTVPCAPASVCAGRHRGDAVLVLAQNTASGGQGRFFAPLPSSIHEKSTFTPYGVRDRLDAISEPK